MALQLLKRNYTMPGYEAPVILKLPQGEERWAPRRLPVDIGDVMMNIRMDDGKNKYIGENVSKYAQGVNPYGEWGYPYKINKNNIRPPIIDPKFYQPLSRMPVKFDSITSGPIVKSLYEKKIEIAKVAPETIIDKVCPDYGPRISMKGNNYTDNTYHEGNIEKHLKQPHASIPYHPSMPVHLNTGVPEIELDAKIYARPQMGIHFPFHVSDQSRDINNMRTPMHVAVKPGYKDPYTFIQVTPQEITNINENLQNISASSGYNPNYSFQPDINTNIDLDSGIQTSAQTNLIAPTPTIDNITRDGYDLTPKVQTSAWYNPNYYLIDLTDRQISERISPMINDNLIYTNAIAPTTLKSDQHNGYDIPITTRNIINTSCQTNINSKLLKNGELGNPQLKDIIHPGNFSPKANIPTIQNHQEYNRIKTNNLKEYFHIQNQNQYNEINNKNYQINAIKNKLQIQSPPLNKNFLDINNDRIIPISNSNKFVRNTF
jgi:hypothetical protein